GIRDFHVTGVQTCALPILLSVRCAAYGERRRLAPLADLVREAIELTGEPDAAGARGVAIRRLRRLGQRLDIPLQYDVLLGLLGFGELPERGGEWVSDGNRIDLGAVSGGVGALLSGLGTEWPVLGMLVQLHHPI